MREYTEKHYLPAAAAYCERSANSGAFGRNLFNWQHSLQEKWDGLRLGALKVETRGAEHAFEVQVWLNDLEPQAVRLELYADGIAGSSGQVR